MSNQSRRAVAGGEVEVWRSVEEFVLVLRSRVLRGMPLTVVVLKSDSGNSMRIYAIEPSVIFRRLKT